MTYRRHLGRWSRAAFASGAVACAAITLSACGSTTAGVGTSSTAASTTTTTSLPVPVEIVGSNSPQNPIGPIFRVPVMPVAQGQQFPPPVPSGVINVAGTVKIGFRQIGSGPDLVLIMGQHGTMTWWDPSLLSALAGHFRVTIFDLPGVGYSQASAANSLNTYADLTAGFIDALGLISPVVLGWGLGGQVGMALAERHHRVLSRLILVDSGAGGSGASAPAPSVTGLFNSPLETTTALAGVMFPANAPLEKSGWLTRIAAVAPDDIVDTGVATEAAVEAAARSDESLRQGLSTLKLPTLVVYGAQDEVFPATESMALRQAIPHARSLVYADGGYAAMFQHVASFATSVEKFGS